MDKRKIHYHGIDNKPEFLEKTRNTLSNLDIGVNTSEANVFVENGLKLGGKKQDLVIASHMFYHCNDPEEQGKSFIGNIVHSLKSDGVGLLIHESPNSDMCKIRSRHGSPLMLGATAQISNLCEEIELTSYTIPIDARLEFPDLSDTMWEELKSIDHYERISKTSSEGKTAIELLGFILQRDLSELAEERRLDSLVSTVRKKKLENNKQDPHLVVRSEVQIVLPKESKEELKVIVEDACSYVINQKV